MVLVFQRVTGHMQNYTYLIADGPSGKAAVVDPSFDAGPVEEIAAQRGFEIIAILVTHRHYDHVTDVAGLAKRTGAKVYAHKVSQVPHDVGLNDGHIIELGASRIRAMHTPGHTECSTCYYIEDFRVPGNTAGKPDGCLFTGDTLFLGECGRMDLPGGDPAEMWKTLTQRIPALPQSTIIFPGHDYAPIPFDTLGNQLKTNYTMAKRSKEEFVAWAR
ncbi:MAG: MBL fold metallo-hydrolase [Euryarchaeota archaeon]|nr:MBL fold metallo-hydrolase [Euryarchaeota archaeon]